MGFTVDYMMRLNNCNVTTVLKGDGEFLDYETNEIHKIHSINIPFTSSGKHIAVFSKDSIGVIENRDYFEGKILSFTCEKVKHW